MWICALAAAFFSLALAKAPISLTQANFEHDTQIGLGMTTGDWFIKFYAPWCGHCKRLAPVWEEVADKLDGQVNVAEVDCTKEKGLAERFEIHGYPTILFFKDNKMHKFLGGRDAETLTEFALSNYKDAKVIKDVPAAPGLKARLSKVFHNIVGDFDHIWRNRPAAGAALLLTGLMFGLAVGISLGAAVVSHSRRKSPTPAVKKKTT